MPVVQGVRANLAVDDAQAADRRATGKPHRETGIEAVSIRARDIGVVLEPVVTGQVRDDQRRILAIGDAANGKGGRGLADAAAD